MNYFTRPLVEKFRHLVRKRTRPMTQDEAEERREFFAKVYALCGLLVFTSITYMVYKKDVDFTHDKDQPNYVAVGQKFNITNDIRVVNFRGFQKISDFVYSPQTGKVYMEEQESSLENIK